MGRRPPPTLLAGLDPFPTRARRPAGTNHQPQDSSKGSDRAGLSESVREERPGRLGVFVRAGRPGLLPVTQHSHISETA